MNLRTLCFIVTGPSSRFGKNIPEEANDKKHRDESWNRLREALKITREDLDWLKNFAERRRHGEEVHASHEVRERAIKNRPGSRLQTLCRTIFGYSR